MADAIVMLLRVAVFVAIAVGLCVLYALATGRSADVALALLAMLVARVLELERRMDRAGVK